MNRSFSKHIVKLAVNPNVGKNARGKIAIGKNVRGKIAIGKNVGAKVVKIP